jgi:hypothetical protein
MHRYLVLTFLGYTLVLTVLEAFGWTMLPTPADRRVHLPRRLDISYCRDLPMSCDYDHDDYDCYFCWAEESSERAEPNLTF